jgi:hypothetical protein
VETALKMIDYEAPEVALRHALGCRPVAQAEGGLPRYNLTPDMREFSRAWRRLGHETGNLSHHCPCASVNQ